MSDDERVPYAEIPGTVRAVLDEIYKPEGVEIWWNSRNRVLFNWLPPTHPARLAAEPLRPRDFPEAAENYANALADGNFA